MVLNDADGGTFKAREETPLLPKDRAGLGEWAVR
jgi:hypothetical protein